VLNEPQKRLAATAPLAALPGIGVQRAAAYEAAGFNRLEDLLFHLPRRYQDRTRLTPLAALVAGQVVQTEGVIEHCAIAQRRRPVLEVLLAADRARLLLRFFHFFPGQARALAPGVRLRVYGEVRDGFHGLEMVHPSYQRLAAQAAAPLPGYLTAVYPTIGGVRPADLARTMQTLIDRLAAGGIELADPYAAVLDEPDAPPLSAALLRIHRPPDAAAAQAILTAADPAMRRLLGEELSAQLLALRRWNRRRALHHAPPLAATTLAERLRRTLPFDLTAAQQRVWREVGRDLTGDRPAMRLVQGDVGSGKTVIAALAAAQAAASGYQTALIAPTELLAEQHAATLGQLFAPLAIETLLLTSAVKGQQRRRVLAALAAGAPLAIGTHALLQETVQFPRLGLIVVDEQQRFGVGQRLALSEKGGRGSDGETTKPHQLLLTATPIPRTLAMTAYAGIQVSSIDQRPPGRTPVRTVTIDAARRNEVIARLAAACRAGRQAYWVCTLVEDNEEIPAEAAEKTHDDLKRELPGLRIGLIHGRLKPQEKEARMTAFRDHRLDVLVATTVIEVGVDVPNASLMIIDNAERLGLAQLHQLRGRVGRGAAESSCVLLYRRPLGEVAKARLAALRRSDDGFKIAELDLELRGPGEMLGTRQTGVIPLKLADFARDRALLPAAERRAARLEQNEAAAEWLLRRWIGRRLDYAGA